MSDPHREAYREEARELLAELESTLLELEHAPGDAGLIGRVFRQLHTIKGSGAMFGFDEIAAYTHEIETVYDRVRAGALRVTPELISFTLAARDHIRALLEGGAAPQGGEAALAGFRGMLAGGTAAPAPEAAPEIRTWRIRFTPPEDVFLRGVNLPALFDELRAMGPCTAVCRMEGIPDLAQLDPRRCCLRWELELATAQDERAIRDVFLFVEDGAELSIEPVEAAAAPSSAREIAEPAASIRVAAPKIDGLLNAVGELVTVEARLAQFAAGSGDPELLFIAEEVERLTGRLRDSAMSMRMLPIGSSFGLFRRLVRDLSRELHKDVELITEGGETELDKTVIEQLNDVLVHILRNAMDHGIEPAAERLAAGKPARGCIRLSAVHSGVHVHIRVEDDGSGLDRDRIFAKAVEQGIAAPDAELSDEAVYALVFRPGFSTAARITGVSGRGVGMDVVQQTVQNLRGAVAISSRKGAGTVISLQLPLTLAIIDGLLVNVAEEHFVLPRASVVECMEVRREEIEGRHGRRLVAVRGELVPFLNLRRHFDLAGELPALAQVMIAETPAGRLGIVVDRVVGDHQIVLKPLGVLYRGAAAFSGATILGDGRIALVLDVGRLLVEAGQAVAA